MANLIHDFYTIDETIHMACSVGVNYLSYPLDYQKIKNSILRAINAGEFALFVDPVGKGWYSSQIPIKDFTNGEFPRNSVKEKLVNPLKISPCHIGSLIDHDVATLLIFKLENEEEYKYVVKRSYKNNNVSYIYPNVSIEECLLHKNDVATVLAKYDSVQLNLQFLDLSTESKIQPLVKPAKKPHGNAERFSSAREQVLGAALHVVTHFPSQCQSDDRKFKATKIAGLIDEKSGLFWPDDPNEPPLSRGEMENLIREWLSGMGPSSKIRTGKANVEA
jgi:hypothetical protein